MGTLEYSTVLESEQAIIAMHDDQSARVCYTTDPYEVICDTNGPSFSRVQTGYHSRFIAQPSGILGSTGEALTPIDAIDSSASIVRIMVAWAIEHGDRFSSIIDYENFEWSLRRVPQDQAMMMVDVFRAKIATLDFQPFVDMKFGPGMITDVDIQNVNDALIPLVGGNRGASA